MKQSPPKNPVAVVAGGREVTAEEAATDWIRHDYGCPRCGGQMVLHKPHGERSHRHHFQHRKGERRC